MDISPDKLRFNVYVIELDKSVMKNRKFLAENPNLNSSLPCYYVGITGLTPEERFRNHKRGYKSSRIVKKFGMRLVPDIYEKRNPMTYEDASNKERKLASELRSKGHGVWQK